MSNETTPAAPTMADTANADSAEKTNGSVTDATTGSNSDASAAVTAEKVKEAERKFKLKFGKTEREVSEKEALMLAQKGWAADERFQEAAKAKKVAEQFFNSIKDDPDKIDDLLKHLGKDPVEVYKKRLAKELQRKLMTPEQIELEELRDKVRRGEEESKKRQQEEHQKKVEELQAKYEQQYDVEMSQAISKSGLPKTPMTIRRCAEIQYRALEQGYDLPWDVVIESVKKQYQQDFQEMFGTAEADSLEKLFGEEVGKKFTTASLKKRVVDPEAVTQENRKAVKSEPKNETPKYASEQDWEEKMKKFRNS